MSNHTDTIMRRWFGEVWSEGKEELVDQLLAADAKVHGRGPDNAAGAGREPFKAFLRQIRTAFPDIRITVEEAIEAGDRVAVRCRVTGTHTGPGLSPTPTGKRIDIGGMCFVHIRNGQVAEGWNNFDFLAMYQQLGVPPA